MSTAEAPFLQVRGVTKVYGQGAARIDALKGVDLDVRSGELIAIMGPSGCGKSTLMHILGCLDRPTEGEYRLDDRDVSRLSDRELSRVRGDEIGFVFQTFNLIPELDVLENVSLPFLYVGTPRDGEARAREAIEQVGLAGRATHRPSELSGGERQRTAIARALVNDPLVILADEPTGNLDTATSEGILELFDRLHEQGKTIVLVTHDEQVASRCRRLIRMRDGELISDEVNE